MLDMFGAHRILWGSDWPVLLLAGDYARWAVACDELLAHLSDGERNGIWGGNALRFYGLQTEVSDGHDLVNDA